jgi:hypothetical protein
MFRASSTLARCHHHSFATISAGYLSVLQLHFQNRDEQNMLHLYGRKHTIEGFLINVEEQAFIRLTSDLLVLSCSNLSDLHRTYELPATPRQLPPCTFLGS